MNDQSKSLLGSASVDPDKVETVSHVDAMPQAAQDGGLGTQAREGETLERDIHRFAVVSSDYSRPFMAGAYASLEAATKAQCGSPEKWPIYVRYTHPTTRETADHAELARLAEAATPGPWSYRDMTPNTYGPAFVDSAEVQSLAICGEAVGLSETHGFCLQVDSEVRMANAAFIAAANPATVVSILAENAALRGERTGDDYAAQAEVDEHAGKALDWEIIAGSWKDRATQAERQRDELRKALETARDVLRKHYVDFDGEPEDAVALGRAWAETEQVLANQGADQ